MTDTPFSSCRWRLMYIFKLGLKSITSWRLLCRIERFIWVTKAINYFSLEARTWDVKLTVSLVLRRMIQSRETIKFWQVTEIEIFDSILLVLGFERANPGNEAPSCNTSLLLVILGFHSRDETAILVYNGTMSLKFCIIIDSKSQDVFYYCSVHSNMAAVTSHENRELDLFAKQTSFSRSRDFLESSLTIWFVLESLSLYSSSSASRAIILKSRGDGGVSSFRPPISVIIWFCGQEGSK